MTPADLLQHAADALDRLRIPYLVTGSIASVHYGEPRFTNDIDIVIRLIEARVASLRAAFPPPAFYLDELSIRDAIATCGQFNVIHAESGLKIDFMIPDSSEFNASRFRRARRAPTPGGAATFSSPEDVILKKLEFFSAGGSEKHIRDILGVLRVSGTDIDRAYLGTWAARLGVAELWEKVRQRADSGK